MPMKGVYKKKAFVNKILYNFFSSGGELYALANSGYTCEFKLKVIPKVKERWMNKILK